MSRWVSGSEQCDGPESPVSGPSRCKVTIAVAFVGRSRTRHFTELCRRHVAQHAECGDEGTVVTDVAGEGGQDRHHFRFGFFDAVFCFGSDLLVAGPSQFAGAGQLALEF